MSNDPYGCRCEHTQFEIGNLKSKYKQEILLFSVQNFLNYDWLIQFATRELKLKTKTNEEIKAASHFLWPDFICHQIIVERLNRQQQQRTTEKTLVVSFLISSISFTVHMWMAFAVHFLFFDEYALSMLKLESHYI